MKKNIFPLLLVPFCLVGCSGNPSNSDIEKAFAKENVVVKANLARFGIISDKKIEVTDSKCKKNDVGGEYLCNVAVKITTQDGKTTETTGMARLSKGNDGWISNADSFF